jgi:hypothetical protein
MSTSQLAHPLPATTAPRAAHHGSGAAALLGLLGAGALITGVRLSWLSTFDHLVTQSGWGTLNGTILTALGVVASVLAVAQLVIARRSVRWLLVGCGFLAAGFAGYVLAQLYRAFASLDTMSFAHKGPGLYVALAGGALVFLTVFAPMPDEVPATGRRGSALRWPVAGCAAVAALAHVPVTPEHLTEARYLGVLFLLLTVVLLLGATAVLATGSGAAYALLAGVSLLAVAGYVVSRTAGLPLVADDIGRWFEPLGIVSVLAEAATAAFAGVALRRAHLLR